MTSNGKPTTSLADQVIRIEGARTNNLKNVSIDIPRGNWTVITGPSGSGKSSLAFDTVFAEGQRQFIETLSLDARRLLKYLKRPDVDYIGGLPPTVAVNQRGRIPNSRSTVATLTEIYDYLRLLYARCGLAHCYQCGQPISRQSTQQILDAILRLPEGSRVVILAPIVRNEIGTHQNVLQFLFNAGFARCRIDGERTELEPLPKLNENTPHTIEAVIDRIVIREDVRDRLWESLQLALKHGNDTVVAAVNGAATAPSEKIVWHDMPFSTRYACPKCGIVYQELEPRTFSFNSQYGACPLCEGTGYDSDGNTCSSCGGSRLRQEARNVTVADKRLDEVCALTLDEALSFFKSLNLPDEQQQIAEPVLEQIRHRLTFLTGIGLDYLSLDRRADTLSGGEYQRVRLATSLGNGLTGTCYVLDEPSIGLHPTDNQRLIECLRTLQQIGNTVIVVEHDDMIINAADYVVEIGPGAGRYGGKICRQERGQQSNTADNTLAECRALAKSRSIRNDSTNPVLTLCNVNTHNLKNLTVTFPLQKLTCVTGVSGSGKSSLVNETLVPLMKSWFKRPSAAPVSGGTYADIPYLKLDDSTLDKLVVVDQLPLGQSGRSNAATYCGVFGIIRELFAETKEAKRRGYKASRFSFNSPSGRCEHCRGRTWNNMPQESLQIANIVDAEFVCPFCNGKRFNSQTLAVKYRGKSVADVLDMTIDEAADFFVNFQKISRFLRSFQQIGLGYLTLGQPASKLSGGESQRVKLATELAKVETGSTLYILDEPTTGLHRTDVARLMDVLCGLVERGNTVIVIEHNLDVMRRSDYLLELGPVGGKNGGYLLAPQGLITN